MSDNDKIKLMSVDINSIKTNDGNPRYIKSGAFRKLVRSIEKFPKMLEIRPIVVDENNVILGGNMRYRACVELGYKKVVVTKASNLTEAQKNEFIVKDNVPFGEWDYDVLANQYDYSELIEWGVDMPDMTEDIEEEKINPEYPIVARMDESYNLVIIAVESEMNMNNISEILQLGKRKDFKSNSVGRAQIISFDEFKTAVNEYANKE